MFLLDDILLAPVNGLVAVCRKVEEAARESLENRGKDAMTALAELHRRLEGGSDRRQDFDARNRGSWKKSSKLQKYASQVSFG